MVSFSVRCIRLAVPFLFASIVPLAANAASEPASSKGEPHSKYAVDVSLDVGFSRVDLGGFSDSLGLDKTAANGGAYGGGLDFRLRDMLVGVRFRGFDTTQFTLWTALAEVGYGFKLRPLQPVLSIHGGYAWSTGFETSAFSSSVPALNVLPPDVRVHGPTVGVEASGMFWVIPEIGLGPFLSFDLLPLSRSQNALPQSLVQLTPDIRDKPLYNETGSGFGWALTLGFRGALDLGF